MYCSNGPSDLEKRRLSDFCDMCADQLRHVAEEEGKQQSAECASRLRRRVIQDDLA